MENKVDIYKKSQVQLNNNALVSSDVFMYTTDVAQPKHAHEFFEIGITLSGNACHHFSQDTYSLKRGSVYLIPIGQPHTISKTSNWKVQNLYFIPTITFLTQQNPLLSGTLFSRFFMHLFHKKTDKIVHLELSPASLEEVERVLISYTAINLSNDELIHQFKQNSLLNLLIILCDAYYQQTDTPLPILDLRIPKILSLIEENQELPTTDLIHLITLTLNLHPQYINKLVKASLGTSLSSLITETKIKNSCIMLQSNQPITDIAQKMGFFDHAHYHKNFVKYFGISPSQFRKNLQATTT